MVTASRPNIKLVTCAHGVFQVPARKKEWGKFTDQSDHPLVSWSKIIGATVVNHPRGAISYVVSDHPDVLRKFYQGTSSWQLLNAVNRMCYKYAHQGFGPYLDELERTRLWRGIDAKLNRWIRNNPIWRDQLYWSWGTHTLRDSFASCIDVIAGLISVSTMEYMRKGNVKTR